MAIELGAFKQKAAAAKEAKEAQERVEAERAQAEQEAKGREGERVVQELGVATQGLAEVDALLDEYVKFPEEDLAILPTEDQETFRAQFKEKQELALELHRKVEELQGRQEGMEAGIAAETSVTEVPIEASIEKNEEQENTVEILRQADELKNEVNAKREEQTRIYRKFQSTVEVWQDKNDLGGKKSIPELLEIARDETTASLPMIDDIERYLAFIDRPSFRNAWIKENKTGEDYKRWRKRVQSHFTNMASGIARGFTDRQYIINRALQAGRKLNDMKVSQIKQMDLVRSYSMDVGKSLDQVKKMQEDLDLLEEKKK